MANERRSADQMVSLFKADSKLLERLHVNPVQVLEETAEVAKTTVWQGDLWLYRVAVGVLGALALIAAIGSIILAGTEGGTPEVLVSLGSAAVGALVGLFAPSPTGR